AESHDERITRWGEPAADCENVAIVDTPIRVVVADDTYLVRAALEQILGSADGIEVVASAHDLDSLTAAIERERPDAVVTAIRRRRAETDEGIQGARKLRGTSPQVGVVVLSQYADPDYALALLEEGSRGRGYLLKERVNDPAQLAQAVRATVEGDAVIDPKV